MNGRHQGHSGRERRRLLKLLGLAAVAMMTFIAVAIGAQARAPQRGVGLVDAYTHHEHCPRGGGSVDPINTVWTGPNALGGMVARGFERYGDWTHDDYKSPFPTDYQAVRETGGCYRDDRQRADDCAICNRNHIRLFSTARGKALYIVGDAHHDTVVFGSGCDLPARHVASSFNKPRNLIMRFWPGRKHYDRWRNTQRLTQCDGRRTRSDGYVGIMRATHPK